MPDEFFEKYSRLSHEELFAMLAAGDPRAVDALVAIWKSLETTASGLSATLRADLAKLAVAWESQAGREAQLRLGAIAGFAQMLAEEYAAMQNGLSAMSSALSEAKQEAEPAEPTATVRNATLGATFGVLTGNVDGVIGATMGHPKDKEEARNAHDRIVRLVAELAAEYRVTEYRTWPRHVPSGPDELPQPDAPPPSSGPPPSSDRPRHNGGGDNNAPVNLGVHGTAGKEKDPPPAQTQPVQGGSMGAAAVVGGVVTTGLAIGGGRDGKGDGKGHHGGSWYDDDRGSHDRDGHHDRGHGDGGHGRGDGHDLDINSQLGVNGPMVQGANIGEASGLALGDMGTEGVGEAGDGRGGHDRYDRDGWHDGWRDGQDGYDGHGMHSELVAEPVAVIDSGVTEGLGAATDANGTAETTGTGSGSPGSGGTHTTHHSSNLAGGGQHVAGNPVVGGNPVIEPVAGTGTPPPAPVNTGWSMASPTGVAPTGVNIAPTGAPPAGAVGSPMRMEESRFAFQGDLVRHEATVESVEVDPNNDEV